MPTRFLKVRPIESSPLWFIRAKGVIMSDDEEPSGFGDAWGERIKLFRFF